MISFKTSVLQCLFVCLFDSWSQTEETDGGGCDGERLGDHGGELIMHVHMRLILPENQTFRPCIISSIVHLHTPSKSCVTAYTKLNSTICELIFDFPTY